MSEKMSANLIERLRGIVRVPITDGMGPAGGEEPDNADFFVRTFPTSPLAREAADIISALQREADGLREALREAVAYADGVSWADGMPIDKQAKRLTFYCATDDGAEYEGVWDVSKARAFVSDGTPQVEAEKGSDL